MPRHPSVPAGPGVPWVPPTRPAPYLEVRAVVAVGVHHLPLPAVPRQHRHHFSARQVRVELRGEDADASSRQRLGKDGFKLRAWPRPSPLPCVPGL